MNPFKQEIFDLVFNPPTGTASLGKSVYCFGGSCSDGLVISPHLPTNFIDIYPPTDTAILIPPPFVPPVVETHNVDIVSTAWLVGAVLVFWIGGKYV